MGSILCEHCAAACCRYLAVPIDKPTSRRDYDDIRWYLMHQNILVFVEDGDWYIQFATTCKNLAADNRCMVYDTRPTICSEYEPGNCDYVGGSFDYDLYFTHAKQIEQYYEKRTGKRLGHQATPPKRRAKKVRRPLKGCAHGSVRATSPKA